MKYSFVMAALLGAIAVQDVQALSRYNRRPISYAQASDSSSTSSSSSSSSCDDESALSIRGEGDTPAIATKWNDKNPHPGFQANHDDFFGYEGLGYYDRKVPDNFQGPGSNDDQFMNSMITKYALELATPEGKPTG